MPKKNVVVVLEDALGLRQGKKRAPGMKYNPVQKGVIRKVVNKLREGDSKLGRLLDLGYSMYAVIAAIKAQKCIANLGSTYLEQTVAGCIRDLCKDGTLRTHLIDKYRAIFGLPPVSHVDDDKQKPQARPTRLPGGVTARIDKALGIGHVK